MSKEGNRSSSSKDYGKNRPSKEFTFENDDKQKKPKKLNIDDTLVSENDSTNATTANLTKSFKCLPAITSHTSSILDYSLKNPFDPSIIRTRRKSEIPSIEARNEPYSPMPYIFRVPNEHHADKILSQTAKCPPYHIQLDHSIAVVWSLYSKEEVAKPLGINQLQWAWGFINNIRDYHGRHPLDIEHCLETTSDELLEQYADLAEDVARSRASHSFADPLANSTALSTASERKDDFCSYRSECGNPNCKAPVLKNYKKQTKFADENEISFMESSDPLNFSVNYNDIVNRTTAHGNVSVFETKDNCNCHGNKKGSNVGVLTILSEWRKDQMKKILAELNRLQSIEDYISGTGKEFEPYIDEKDREMHLILAEKVQKARLDKNATKK